MGEGAGREGRRVKETVREKKNKEMADGRPPRAVRRWPSATVVRRGRPSAGPDGGRPGSGRTGLAVRWLGRRTARFGGGPDWPSAASVADGLGQVADGL